MRVDTHLIWIDASFKDRYSIMVHVDKYHPFLYLGFKLEGEKHHV